MKFQFIKYFILISLSLSTIACGPKIEPILVFSDLPVFTVLLPCDLEHLRRQINYLPGVKMVRQGSRLEIVLFTDYFFQPVSTKLHEDYDISLRLIALYLHNYLLEFSHPFPLHVDGYSDQILLPEDRLMLSRRYAQAIANYLILYGFSPAQLSVNGYGFSNLIGDPTTARGNSYNRRVVIRVF